MSSPNLFRARWTKARFDIERKAIKESLEDKETPKAKAQYLTKRILELEHESTSLGHLRGFVYGFYALMLHRDYGVLHERTVQKISRILSTILKTQRLRPKKSELAYLYRDMHLLLSQIHLKGGRIQSSGWQQQMAFYAGSERTGEDLALDQLSTGLRAFRLGHGDRALNCLHSANASELSESDRFMRDINLIRLHRLRGEPQEAKGFIKSNRDKPLSTDQMRELHWEAMLLEVLSTQDLTKVIAATRWKKEHNLPSYVLDAFLFSRVSSNREWLKRFQSVGELGRMRASKFKKFGLYHQATVFLREAYDFEISLLNRLERAEPFFEEHQQLPSIERELLVLGALARWLTRNRAYTFASLSLSEYVSISLKLSGGNCSDALGLVGDLLQSDWYSYHPKEKSNAA